HGEVAETVIELEPAADLVVIGKRGESGNYSPGHLGSKVERVIRGSVRPVLIVPRIYMPITRVVVAFDGGSSALKALEHVIGPQFDGMECHVVIVCDNVAESDRRAGVAQRALRNRPASKIVMFRGEVEERLIEHLRQGMGDLLVMGAYGHSRIRELIIGSTTTAMIRMAKVPVLLFRFPLNK
ncbi:MAG: universal stress protein, partial [Alphaproteobacteria bacterium]